LLFALAKAHDDCSRYEQAFAYYQQGNRYSGKRVGSYDRSGQEALTHQLMEAFFPERLAGLEPVSQVPLIFICGMFRAGTTLLEQQLAAHPQLAAGGEINFFNQQAPLPGALERAAPQLRALGQAYLDYLQQTFPGGTRITNKRPDNFLYLGLLRALFPQACFIHSRRAPLDTCLSIYFQQFEAPLKWTAELLDIGHYYGR
jgi:hypothetical protein